MPKPYLVPENHRYDYWRSAPVYLTESRSALSVKHRYYVASLILHDASRATAQLLSLSFYVYLISSDDGSIIRIFVQIGEILKERAGYVVLIGRVS